jgi:hypothetical protein
MFRYSTAVLTAIALLVLGGCAPPNTPSVRVWQPWTRVLGNTPELGTINVSADYSSEILPGSNGLVTLELERTISDLLERRGFSAHSGDNLEYKLSAKLKTKRRDHIRTGYFSRTSYRMDFTTGSSSTKTSSGVAIASLLSAIEFKKDERAISDVHTVEAYTHTLSLEIGNDSREVVWIGESTWDSESPDIRHHLVPALQILLSSLPSDPDLLPNARTVQEGKGMNFFEAHCAKKWFSCPAIPYRIAFSQPESWGIASARTSNRLAMGGIRDEIAMEAYYDLLQTADFALPRGSTDYSHPLDDVLWKRVQIGGEYMLTSGTKVRVLIDLVAHAWGYEVTKCRVAKDKEWILHTEKITKWKMALEEYFDFWE